jgi:RimJ/RimL family protein N-acetyltransferase
MTEPVVSLRNVEQADLPIFFEQQRDPEATAMAAFPSREWEPHMSHWSRVLATDGAVVRTVIADGRVAGNIVSWDHMGEREVGYWLGKEFWGRGIATSALTAFLPLLRERPLYAHVAKHNTASRRVLEKCGFRIVSADGTIPENASEPVAEFVLRLD